MVLDLDSPQGGGDVDGDDGDVDGDLDGDVDGDDDGDDGVVLDLDSPQGGGDSDDVDILDSFRETPISRFYLSPQMSTIGSAAPTAIDSARFAGVPMGPALRGVEVKDHAVVTIEVTIVEGVSGEWLDLTT